MVVQCCPAEMSQVPVTICWRRKSSLLGCEILFQTPALNTQDCEDEDHHIGNAFNPDHGLLHLKPIQVLGIVLTFPWPLSGGIAEALHAMADLLSHCHLPCLIL